MKRFIFLITICIGICFLLSLTANPLQAHTQKDKFEVMTDGSVHAGEHVFKNMGEYFKSDYFKTSGKRCGFKRGLQNQAADAPLASASDCTTSKTVIRSEYYPGVTYTIPVVFHIIHKTDGTGNISDQRIYDQMEVLNEDYGAISGSLGENGYDTKIQFTLEDITRTANNNWHNDNDESGFKAALGWDQSRYLNVYVNSAGGYLGYAYLPQDMAGDVLDGVVCLYSVTGGRDLAGGDEFDQGRTLVHEVGHYLGLLHTFAPDNQSACLTGFAAGDLIDDTNSETDAHYGCSQTNSCSTPDPIHNYMNYTDDICMYLFTDEQANRAVCGLVNYRSNLYTTSSGTATLTVTSPNGGESWEVGASQNITWSSTGTVGNVAIEISSDNGSSWRSVTSSTSNDGTYSWTVPDSTSTECLIRVSEASDSDPTDTSNAVFSISTATAATISVTAPNGGESWDVGSSHSITWSSTGTVGNVKIEYSSDNGSSWNTERASTSNDGSYSWTVPDDASSQCLVRVSESSDGSPSDTSDAVFSIEESGTPTISLNRTAYNFAAAGFNVTGSQFLRIGNSGTGTLAWSVSDDSTWLTVTPTSGSGPGEVFIGVTNTTVMAAGTYTGTVTVTDANATNSPQTVSVSLRVIDASQDQAPFGIFSTPVDNSTVRSSIPVTGWVLDDVQVMSVDIYRGTDTLTYIGSANLVEGARSDIEAAYPTYPKNYSAGWGYMMLTYFLPNGGNGTFTLTAIAEDYAGQTTILGTKTITVDNDNATKPFGAIDNPGQGSTVYGTNSLNSGWVLTPQPGTIPIDGSTINIYVDGAFLGHPVYNVSRPDIEALFPGYNNSSRAHAYFRFDTTVYDNGIHTIYWTATDDGGNSDGIGSRFFSISNTGSSRSTALDNSTSRTGAFERIPLSVYRNVPIDNSDPVGIKKGYNPIENPMEISPNNDGVIHFQSNEMERIVLSLTNGDVKSTITGYFIVGKELRRLPIGSSLDYQKGLFYWQPGPGFLGVGGRGECTHVPPLIHF